jgi:ABC-type multidrug transport system fused ATPase/permease subunit
VSGAVTFDNVHFAYPQRPDAEVLKGISFSVKPGRTLALVGSSGCGKSTTVSLLLRFYDPLSGGVVPTHRPLIHHPKNMYLQQLDEHKLSALNVQYARSVMSVVSQEPVLFNCSIEDNITYGLKNISHEDVVTAAKAANIDDFICSLPSVG